MLVNSEFKVQGDAIDKLRAFIDARDFAPGDRLPPERELTVNFGISRTALRKALDTLEHEGQIWRQVGKGTFIASRTPTPLTARLSELAGKVTPVHMMRARLSLEPAMAREAAINASDAAVRDILASRDRAIDAQTWDDYEAEDDTFHRSIAEATGNILLLDLFDHLNQVRRAVAWKTVIRHSDRPARDHSSFGEHDRIAEAILARNPAEAHSAMRDHLGSVSARLFGEI